MKSKNQKVLNSFIKYCEIHPELRFWQALQSWSKWNYIYVANAPEHELNAYIYDTYYFEGKNK